MQNCSEACGEVQLIQLPEADCKTSLRYNNPDRLVFKGCDVDLATPETNIDLYTLYQAGKIAISSPLANWGFGAPTVDEINYADCNPTFKLISGRQLTVEDRIKIAITDGSPAVTAPFRDYEFWASVRNQQFNLNFGIAYCNGDIRWARDEEGNWLTMSVLVYVDYQRPSGNGGKFVEFKNITIDANGDFLDLNVVPTSNWITAGIKL